MALQHLPAALTKKYTIDPMMVGEGSFGKVYKCTNKEGETLAVKVITKSNKFGKDEEKGLKQEIRFLKVLDHPRILKLYDAWNLNKLACLVTEFIGGGELFDRLKAKETYSERDAGTLLKIILGAIEYMHSQKICHRDLKPENLILISPDDDTSVKLIDFGFATHEPKGGITDKCGTLLYVAPEVLRPRPYTVACDMWSIGVIAYILLTGYPPIFERNMQKMKAAVKAASITYDNERWKDITSEAKAFCRGLLTRDVEERWTAKQALKSPWLQSAETLPTIELEGAKAGLEEYQREKLAKAFKIVEAREHMKDLFEGLMEGDEDA